jgi:hypothetical protein
MGASLIFINKNPLPKNRGKPNKRKNMINLTISKVEEQVNTFFSETQSVKSLDQLSGQLEAYSLFLENLAIALEKICPTTT